MKRKKSEIQNVNSKPNDVFLTPQKSEERGKVSKESNAGNLKTVTEKE